jgi:hypothetical protein
MFNRPRDPLKELAQQAQRGFKQQAGQIDALRRQNQDLANWVARQNSESEAGQTMGDLKRGEEHYAQVIMLAGYAGFFTLWTQTRGEMSLWMFASTGALISISLTVFVGFELFKAWSLGRFYQQHSTIYAHELNAKIEQIQKHWHVAFLISSVTGVTAGLSLLLWFVFKSIYAAAMLVGAV